MHEETDSEYARFFSYLNLFVFFMLVLVLGSNLLVMFVGWEGVGLCSYLLIGYYYVKKSAGDAGEEGLHRQPRRRLRVRARRAAGVRHLRHARLPADRRQGHGDGRRRCAFGTLSLITLLLFVGATGKSAQIPLYIWLPDAMEGPTPVSALIHAATMVTAGVYMIGRNAVLFEHAPDHARRRRRRRRGHRALRRHHRPGAERHQARAGLLDGVAARLHVPGDGRGRVRRRHLPPLHARVLQGLPVPRLGRGDSRAARRAGHPPHGRPEEGAADHLLDVPDRLAGDCRRAAAWRASSRRTRSCSRPSRTATVAVGDGRRDVAAHRHLHVPARVPDVPRRAAPAPAVARHAPGGSGDDAARGPRPCARPRRPRARRTPLATGPARRRRRWRWRSSCWPSARCRPAGCGWPHARWAATTSWASGCTRRSPPRRRRWPNATCRCRCRARPPA